MRMRAQLVATALVAVSLVVVLGGPSARAQVYRGQPAEPVRSLPATNRDVVLLAAGGTVLLLAGTVLMLFARRRDSAAEDGPRDPSPAVQRLRRDVGRWSDPDDL